MKKTFLLVICFLAIACGSEESNQANNSSSAADQVGLNDTADNTQKDTNNTGSAETKMPETKGLPVLGNGSHSVDQVMVYQIANAQNQISQPRDLEFNPKNPNDLYVLNYGTESITVLSLKPNSTLGNFEIKRSMGNTHFLAKPSGLAFADNGFFATIHATDIATQPTTPADFMGPTLWDSDESIFDGGHGGHMDMLHNSPMGMGIAWETGNAYWVFDGYHSALARYDFVKDHGPGGADHSDGIVYRYAQGEVKMVRGIASHMEMDRKTNLLYIADTGHSRIAVLDIKSGEQGMRISPNYDGTKQYFYNNAKISTLIDGKSINMTRPSGLAIHNDIIYVSDNESSTIFAFDKNGTMIDYLSLGLDAGSIMGIEIDDKGNLWFVNNKSNEVMLITPK